MFRTHLTVEKQAKRMPDPTVETTCTLVGPTRMKPVLTGLLK